MRCACSPVALALSRLRYCSTVVTVGAAGAADPALGAMEVTGSTGSPVSSDTSQKRQGPRRVKEIQKKRTSTSAAKTTEASAFQACLDVWLALAYAQCSLRKCLCLRKYL